MNTEKKVQKTISLPREVEKQLSEYSKEKDIAQSHIIEKLIRYYLKKNWQTD